MRRLRNVPLPPLQFPRHLALQELLGEAPDAGEECDVSETLVVRTRFSIDDRTFTVLAEPWYDPSTQEWKGRLLFVPLDRSLPSSVSTGPLKRSRRRDDLFRWLGGIDDRELARAFRAITLPALRRTATHPWW